MTEPAPTKETLREMMRDKRRDVSQADRTAAGRTICQKLTGSPVDLLLRAWRVCIYLSTKSEIPTRYVARAVWDAGREVCVPAWSRNDKQYKLYAIDPRTKLINGHHGIREPAVRVPVMPWDVNAFVLPGLAFDSCGGRLGYGAGHYDHILSKAIKSAPKIAVCYDWQVLETRVPQEPHDIAMDWIVTDSRVIDCAANRKAAAAEKPHQPSGVTASGHPLS